MKNYAIVSFAGRSYLYATRSDQTFPLDDQARAIATRASEEELTKIEAEACGAFKRAEEAPLEARCLQYRDAVANSLQQIVLGLTENCNLRCRYCIYSGSYSGTRVHNSGSAMSWDVARKAIDWLFAHCAHAGIPPGITFYGGEPLLEIALIERCVQYARERSDGVFFTITTNGTLLNRRNRQFLADNRIHLTVSVDGPPEIHNRYRVFPDGRSTHDVIFENLAELQREAPEYFARFLRFSAVLAPPVAHAQRAGFFNQVGHSVVAATLDRYRLDGLPLANGEETETLEDFVAAYRQAVHTLPLEQLFKDYAVCVLAPHLRRIQVRGQGIYGNIHRMGQCIVGARKVFVSPRGDLFPCEKVEGGADVKIGHIDTGVDLDAVTRMMEAWRASVSEKCQECWMRRLCSSCMMIETHGGMSAPMKRDRHCELHRENQLPILGAYAWLQENDPQALSVLEPLLPRG